LNIQNDACTSGHLVSVQGCKNQAGKSLDCLAYESGTLIQTQSKSTSDTKNALIDKGIVGVVVCVGVPEAAAGHLKALAMLLPNYGLHHDFVFVQLHLCFKHTHTHTHTHTNIGNIIHVALQNSSYPTQTFKKI
jgi:hypothetical protein